MRAGVGHAVQFYLRYKKDLQIPFIRATLLLQYVSILGMGIGWHFFDPGLGWVIRFRAHVQSSGCMFFSALGP